MLYDKTDDWEKRQDEKNKEHKMTREEAIKKCHTFAFPETLIQTLENLGLLKFEEKKNVSVIFTTNYQNIRLEEWPKGLVLWVGGEIVWKSWEKYYKKADAVTIEYYSSGINSKQYQAGVIKE